eukprot:CAMPEP_0197599908 /NCGR_PEP_ID=MMETSP1326-20131121/32308_1 /TAXON_ID=1155430 /ORGANISM="Genus nov. species nov., Strain RCC2288" /LENGTH=78 /DNA_ID=CAMNT_0043166939 /DNA_START=15 /DNA_END=247 /DNA_ORIENTATION=+
MAASRSMLVMGGPGALRGLAAPRAGAVGSLLSTNTTGAFTIRRNSHATSSSSSPRLALTLRGTAVPARRALVTVAAAA